MGMQKCRKNSRTYWIRNDNYLYVGVIFSQLKYILCKTNKNENVSF